MNWFYAKINEDMHWIRELSCYWNKYSAKKRLTVCFALSGGIYLAFTLFFPLYWYYADIPPLDYSKLTKYSPVGFLAYVSGISTLFVLYLIALRLLRKIQINPKFVIWVGGLLALILIFSYPQTAIDLFVYAIRSRGWARYGLEPFSNAPELIPDFDPWLGLAGEWVDAPSPYGPIWEWSSLVMYYLSGGNFLGHLVALKVLAFITYLGCAWLLTKLLRIFRPQWVVVGTAFFAWNPLVLLEGVQNAHNDLLMVFFFLLSLWGCLALMLGKKDKPSWVYSLVFVFAFAASVLVKFVTFLVLPFLISGLVIQEKTWPRRFFVGLGYLLIILSIVVLGMALYWPGIEQGAVLSSGDTAGRSLTALMVLALRPQHGTNQAFEYTHWMIYGLFAGIYMWNVWRVVHPLFRRNKEKETYNQQDIIKKILLSSFSVFFGYTLFVASTFHAWYLLWFFPLGALLIGEIRLVRATWVFSFVSLLLVSYYETIRVWVPYLLRNHLVGHLVGVALLMIPTLLAFSSDQDRELSVFKIT